MPRVLCLLACLLPIFSNAADTAQDDLKTRLLAGEVQFFALQHKFADALLLIDGVQAISPEALRRALPPVVRQASDGGKALSLADIELGYRISQRAGGAIRAALDAGLPLAQRNRVAYELAQIYYHKQQYQYAGYALQLIRGELFYPFNHDVDYLRAKIHARSGRWQQAAKGFRRLQHDSRFDGFAQYNLAHVLLQQGRIEEGLEQLKQLAKREVFDEPQLALRDKAALMLGFHALGQKRYAQALAELSRVRLHGAFSARALLGIGWANMALQDYPAALSAWHELAQRDSRQVEVQEALVALPYTFGKLGACGKAVDGYQRAIRTYENALDSMALSRASIERGDLFKQPAFEALGSSEQGMLRLSRLDDMAYLQSLLTRDDFQLAFRNGVELLDLQRRVDAWRRSVRALEALAEDKAQFARHELPAIQNEIEQINTSIATLWRQHDSLVMMLADTRASPPEHELTTVQQALQSVQSRRDAVQRQLERLRKVTSFKPALFRLQGHIEALHEALLPLLQQSLRTLQAMMSSELEQRRNLVQQYVAVARYQLAMTYDLLASAQQGGEMPCRVAADVSAPSAGAP